MQSLFPPRRDGLQNSSKFQWSLSGFTFRTGNKCKPKKKAARNDKKEKTIHAACLAATQSPRDRQQHGMKTIKERAFFYFTFRLDTLGESSGVANNIKCSWSCGEPAWTRKPTRLKAAQPSFWAFFFFSALDMSTRPREKGPVQRLACFCQWTKYGFHLQTAFFFFSFAVWLMTGDRKQVTNSWMKLQRNYWKWHFMKISRAAFH